MHFDFVIKGEIPSMKNDLRVGRYGGLYHDKNSVNRYKINFDRQLPPTIKGAKIKGQVKVELMIYLKDWRKDAHNLPAAVYDCLQSSGVVLNDRQITSGSFDCAIDKDDPRVEVWVAEL